MSNAADDLQELTLDFNNRRFLVILAGVVFFFFFRSSFVAVVGYIHSWI